TPSEAPGPRATRSFVADRRDGIEARCLYRRMERREHGDEQTRGDHRERVERLHAHREVVDEIDRRVDRDPVPPVHHTAHDEPDRPVDLFHRSEEHTSELQSPCNLVCRLLLEKKKYKRNKYED